MSDIPVYFRFLFELYCVFFLYWIKDVLLIFHKSSSCGVIEIFFSLYSIKRLFFIVYILCREMSV